MGKKKIILIISAILIAVVIGTFIHAYARHRYMNEAPPINLNEGGHYYAD